MPIMISIPEDCKPLAEAIQRLIASTEQARQQARGGRAVEYARTEREIGERTAEIERAVHAYLLSNLDVDAPTVVIDGRPHTRVYRGDGRYYTLAGDVVVSRSLYRAERNGPGCRCDQPADRCDGRRVAARHRDDDGASAATRHGAGGRGDDRAPGTAPL